MLKAAIAQRRKSQAEVGELRTMLAEKAEGRRDLETGGDLNDAKVISEIGKLQVLVELLPRRIAFKEEEDAKAEKDLVEATNEFIREHLGPRVRQLATRTRVIVENEMSSHVRGASALMVAVAKSERVRTIERMDCAVSLEPERGAIFHAEGALKAWTEVDEFEKRLVADECLAGDFLKS